MRRFVKLLYLSVFALLFFAAKPAFSQTAAFNPSAASFDFGTVAVGKSSTPGIASFHRTNVLPLTNVTVASVTLSDTVNYSILEECTGAVLLSPADPTVPNRSFCRISVVFHPTATGTLNATISVASNATGSPHVFNLTGDGVEADISPVAPVIPDTPVGQSSGAATVTVTNSGTEPLDIGAIDVVGEDFVNFAISNDNCSNTTVAAASDCIFEVIFSPDEARTFNANILIPSNDPGAPNFLLAITADGVAPSISATTPVIPDTVVGSSSLSDMITVSNGSADAPLEIGQIVLVGEDGVSFSINNDNCSNSTVAPGSDCFFEFTFNPDEIRTFNASVSIPSNDPATPNLLVTLTGDGIAGPVMTVKPAGLQLDFPDTAVGQTSPTRILEIQNTGTTPLENIDVPAPIIPEYAYVQDHCSGSTLLPGESCLVQITFTPGDDLTYTELVTITADGVSPVVVTLEGEGISGPALEILPTSLTLSFPDTGLGRTSELLVLEIHSSGTTPVENIAISAPVIPDFVVVQDNCSGLTLNPGESCLATYAFAPTQVFSFTEILSVSADNLVGIDVTLEGEGIVGPAVATNPSTLNFGDVVVGQTSTGQAVRISNSGTTELSLGTLTLTTGADFTVTSNTCNGASLAVGASCEVVVACNATATGALADSLSIPSDAASSPDSVSLDCNGIQATIASSGSGAFGNLNVGSQGGPNTITITNSGDAVLLLGSLARIGVNTNQFSIRNDACSGQTLAAGDDCTFQAVFNPTAGGSFTDVVLIPNSSATPSFTVNLTGTGIVPVPPGVGLLQVKTDVLDFDLESGQTDSQSTTITNIGDGAVAITSLVLDGDTQFSQVNDCDGQNLAPGAFCTVTVTFSGGSAGNFSGVISIDSNPDSTAFLVLLGSSFDDEIGGGGCSIGTGTQALSLSWMWMGLIPAFGVAALRRRTR